MAGVSSTKPIANILISIIKVLIGFQSQQVLSGLLAQAHLSKRLDRTKDWAEPGPTGRTRTMSQPSNSVLAEIEHEGESAFLL
jgi:hypothetical protein